MGIVTHRSIGESTRKVEITQEEKSQRIEELKERFLKTPWRDFGIDQLSVWVVWASLFTGVFLYCAVKAVVLAIH